MNVLIVGGAGFLGTNLVYRCLEEPDSSVTVLDSLAPEFQSTTDDLRPVWDRIRFIQGDIRDAVLLSECVRDKDVIFNCAGQTSHPLSLKRPLFDVDINCAGNLTLLESVRQHNPEAVVIYTSSSTVIGPSFGDVADETHAERPLDIYSANKAAAEKYHLIYHHVHGLKTIVLRFPNLFGPYGKKDPNFGFVNYFIQLASSDAEIQVFGTGRQTRNLLFVEDASNLLIRAAQELQLIGDLCFATGDIFLSVYEIAQTIVAVFGRGKVTCIDWPEERQRIEVGDVQITSERLRKRIDWNPKFGLVDGLEQTKTVMERNGL